MKLKWKYFLIFIVVISIQIIIIFADIINVPYSIGVNVGSINWEAQSLCITVVLFFVTFFLINRRDIQRQKYQEDVARYALCYTYSSCKEMVRLLDNSNVRACVAKKCDFNSPIGKDEQLQMIIKKPFEYDKVILEFSVNGFLKKEEFNIYLDIKSKYENYVVRTIIFFEIYEQTKGLRDQLLGRINEEISKYGDREKARKPLQ